MGKRVLVPMVEGFEEIEAITVIDVLRRAGLEVVVAGVADGPVKGSRGVVVVPDTTMERAGAGDFDAVVLPGGPGSKALAADSRVRAALAKATAGARLVAAICAAPAVVLGALGYLEGKRATCHPGLAKELAARSPERVVEDGNLITSQGPGTALEFSLALVARLAGPAKAAEIKQATVAA